MIKTFRGILDDGGQDKIRLSTKKGKIGYKIVKFDLFPNKPGWVDYESLGQVFKIKQTAIATTEATVDFADGNLLAAGFFSSTAATSGSESYVQVFEREIFNQDIYVTHTQQSGNALINYYLELEAFNMTDNAAAVSTLRDIRLNPQVGA